MNRFNRRRFLQASALGTAALGLPALSYAQVPNANSDIRVGIAGLPPRGADHTAALVQFRESVSPVCATAIARHSKRLPPGARTWGIRRPPVPMRGNCSTMTILDVVSTATPNHWHLLIVVWGCQAGKDVYVEKPVSHNVWEGRKAVQRVRSTIGLCRRVRKVVLRGRAWPPQSPGFTRDISGPSPWYAPSATSDETASAKSTALSRFPAAVDYDLWCGPAPKEPLMRKNLHYDWHWVWSTGNGDLGNQGIHQMDMARWFLGVDHLSPRVWSVGGRFGYVDDGQTANTQIVFHDYEPAPLIFEVRGLPEKSGSNNMDQFRGHNVGVIVQCEGGLVHVPGYAGVGAVAYDADGKQIQEVGRRGGSLREFHQGRAQPQA